MKSWLLVSLMIVFTSLLVAQPSSTVRLDAGWKFLPGDSLAFADPGFNDAGWKSISVDTIWEQQGYDKLDGFAWYRLHVTIPAALKESAFLKDGLRIHLAKINNFDQTFLNGQLIGINGRQANNANLQDSAWRKEDTGLWNFPRTYVLPIDDPRIHWDGDNVIAVRVFDAGGQGGLWSGGQNLRMVRLSDYLKGSASPSSFRFNDKGTVKKSWEMRNTGAARQLAGNFLVTVTDKSNGELITERHQTFSIPAGDSAGFDLSFPRRDRPSVVRLVFGFPEAHDSLVVTEESPYVLTPKPAAAPRINGSDVYGARPNHPFLYAIPATGDRPMKYSAKGLPAGLTLDNATGIITGAVSQKGTYHATLTVSNKKGKAARSIDIVIGDRIGLTPQLGWNSWNAWGLSVDQEKVIASAHVYKEKGLIDHGWNYINIDDGWEIKGDDPRPKRDSSGAILVNEKFPSMKALGDSIHALGLKLGIYSSPGDLTCGGYTASYQHELNDARSYASWGVDYLKYDWCSYDKVAKDTSRAEYMKPYHVMRAALDSVNRDIFYSLCQYGMGNVWEWGAQVGGNSWRTTGDITDTWESVRDIGFSQIANAPYSGPGHWNDPDMLVVGWVGWGPSLHPTGLTPDEQYTHISLWSLLSAPMLIGCDLTRLDDFTLNLLTNDEVLAVDQDRLGRQAVPLVKEDSIQVWGKVLADSSKAIGIFNLGSQSRSYALDLQKLGFSEPAAVRDLWRQQDRGMLTTFASVVPSHGVILLKVNRAGKQTAQRKSSAGG